jgi:hypothetical protein
MKRKLQETAFNCCLITCIVHVDPLSKYIPTSELFPTTGSMLRTFELAMTLNAIPTDVKDTINSLLVKLLLTCITYTPKQT